MLTCPYRFRLRFKSMIDQYELRDLHFHSLMRTKELEVQFNLARFEGEKKRADAETALVRHMREQVSTFHQTEAELRTQLNVYVDKFKQVSAPDDSPLVQAQAVAAAAAAARRQEQS